MALAQDVDPNQFTGLTGWVASVIDSLGAVGVALLVALESIIPPIPSEIVLAMAGYLSAEGRFNVVFIVLAATVGSLLGALVLYWLGAALGEERLKRWLDHIPLVDLQDLEKADRWFERHGRWAVLIGRVVPVVRSLVSVPAGANRMPLGEFILLTTLGSGVWNALIVGAGFTLGSRWEDVDRYSSWFNYAIFAVFGFMIVSWAVKKVRRRRGRAGGGAARGRPAPPAGRVGHQAAPTRDVAPGEQGELLIRGPQVFAGYWNRPDETAKVMTPDGFFKSGDIGTMDERGYTTIVDRKKDMILVSGFNVYPNELEAVVSMHPKVLEVAAVGVPHENSGEAVKLFVVRKDESLTERELFDYCARNLTGYKKPKYIEFRAELPKTNVGKILRRELRDEAAKKVEARGERQPA